MNRAVAVGLASLFAIAVLGRQIYHQLRSGKVRPRGSTTDKTREENPTYYWFSIALEMAMIVAAIYFFLRVIGKS